MLPFALVAPEAHPIAVARSPKRLTLPRRGRHRRGHDSRGHDSRGRYAVLRLN
jgi:hypothetical protein